jgi:Tfp pilus assembly protein PilO
VFYEQVLPTSLSNAQRATYVSLAQLARESNLRLSNRVASAEPAVRASLDRLAISIALEGNYQDIRHFIHRLETGAPFLVIDDLRLDGGTSGETLRLSLTLSTYYRAARDGR